MSHHFREQDQTHRDHPAFRTRQLVHGPLDEPPFFRPRRDPPLLDPAQRFPELTQHKTGVLKLEQLHRRRVHPFHQSDVKCLEESGRRHPEVVAHEQDRLAADSIALPERSHQLSVEIVRVALQPLLELVQHQKHLRATLPVPTLPQRGDGQIKLAAGRQDPRFALQRGPDAQLRPARLRPRHRPDEPDAKAEESPPP